MAARFGGSCSYFDGAQHERRAGFAVGWLVVSGQLSVVSCQWSVVSCQWSVVSRPVIARSLRRSDLAGFWEIIGHTAGREMGFAAVAPC